MRLVRELTCLQRGHLHGELHTNQHWIETRCERCGYLWQGDSVLELLMRIPDRQRANVRIVAGDSVFDSASEIAVPGCGIQS